VDSNLSDLGIFSFQQVICQAKIPAILEDSLNWTSKQALSTILNNHGSHTILSVVWLPEIRVSRSSLGRIDGGLSGCQTCHRDAEWGAGDVVQANGMAEDYRIWISTVFATDPKLDVRAGAAALGDGDFHQLADTRLVDRSKWVALHDF